MKTVLTLGFTAALLALTACGEDTAPETTAPAAPPATVTTPAPETQTERQTREAGEAIQDAARETGEAASAATRDLRDAAAPAIERARQEGAEALDSARQGLNNLTRSAACQTARAANDAEGIAANCN